MKRRKAVPATTGGDSIGVLGRCLKIVSLFNNIGAECAHGGVFFGAVTDGYDERGGDSILARGKSNRLPVIPSGG